jgi:signal transduction histidine kinase
VLAEVERRGLSADPLGRREADGSSAAGVVLATREPMLVHVDETGPVTSRVAEELLGLGLVAGLAVPLVVQGRAVGVVVAYADASRGAFGEDDRDMALGLAANAAVALAHLRSLGALEEANRTLESTVRSRTHELELALAQRTVLTDQLEERRRALEAANNDLRGLDELKGELLTHIARSFDEPVASIQTAARILARDESPPEKAAKLVDIISGEATRLSELIMSARQAAVLSGDDTGAGAGAVAVPLADLLKRVLAPLRSAIGERRIAVHVKVAQGLEHVLGREEQLEAALRAIVKNAVEYNAPGGAVTVTARPVLREGGSFTEFQVVDTGIGIPADDIPHARELFWKGTTASGERTRGLGLGLAVAGRVAEAHKGMLEISSEPGRGTTVSLLIPAPASPQA